MPADTISFYDTNAVAYAANGSVNPRLALFLAKLRKCGSILELGTGSGKDAKAMVQAGFVVDATDGSRELASFASAYLGQTVRVMRFEDLAAENVYDGVYAAASLLHAPRSSLPSIVRSIYTTLTPNGVAWASFKVGSEEGLDGLGRYYNYFSAAELQSIWEAAAPWAEVQVEGWHGSGFDKRPTYWTTITAIR